MSFLFQFYLPLDEALLEKLLKRCDIDGNGKIDYNEFVSFLVCPVRFSPS